MKYTRNFLIAVDQLVNVVLGGWPDETLSSRAYRNREKSRLWGFAYRFINRLFFWQADHCLGSYLSEVNRNQLPPSERPAGWSDVGTQR